MRPTRWIAVIGGFVCILLATSAAVAAPKTKYKLHYRAELDHPIATRSCRLIVSDERAKERDDPPERLGTWRTSLGVHNHLINTGDGLEAYFADWTADSLQHHGVAVLDRDDEPRIHVVIEHFWIEGYYMHTRLEARLRVELYVPGRRRPAFVTTLELNPTGGKLSVTGLLAKLLDEGVPALARYLASTEVAKVLGAPPEPEEPKTAAPPTAVPVEGGCRNDRDCKGRRICEEGACVDPRDRRR